VEVRQLANEYVVTEAQLSRWFAKGGQDRLSYAQRLGEYLSAQDLGEIQAALRTELLGKPCLWQSSVVFVFARKP
ncbi:MAG: hypothetical protein J7M05_07860, partial [Anaerolineae bacterium]|nr:hypothetical protein [Anaerolineae bacterium]